MQLEQKEARIYSTRCVRRVAENPQQQHRVPNILIARAAFSSSPHLSLILYTLSLSLSPLPGLSSERAQALRARVCHHVPGIPVVLFRLTGDLHVEIYSGVLACVYARFYKKTEEETGHG